MSGSGSSGGLGGNFESAGASCSALVIDTQISSPAEEVVEDLEVGDVLEVSQQTQNGLTLVVVLHEGRRVGGIASSALNRLRECMALGHIYVATVTALSDGEVRVRIQPAAAR